MLMTRGISGRACKQPFLMYGSENQNDPGRTRTCNPRLRRPMPYPLGHGARCMIQGAMWQLLHLWLESSKGVGVIAFRGDIENGGPHAARNNEQKLTAP